jgi:hypothetical protein
VDGLAHDRSAAWPGGWLRLQVVCEDLPGQAGHAEVSLGGGEPQETVHVGRDIHPDLAGADWTGGTQHWETPLQKGSSSIDYDNTIC